MNDKYFNASDGEIAELGFDPDALLRKYDHERDKRLRRDGIAQYIPSSGDFGEYSADPFVTEPIIRDPIEEDVDVVIIGAGLSGWSTAARLRLKGVRNIRVIDKAGDFGGAWYWNRYPGIRCDIESYVYLPLLEEFNYVSTEKYATGQEIFDHVRNVAHKLDLYEGALFQTQVIEARWLEDDKRWLVKTDRGDLLRARFLAEDQRETRLAEAAWHSRDRAASRARHSIPAVGTMNTPVPIKEERSGTCTTRPLPWSGRDARPSRSCLGWLRVRSGCW